jgi:secernin
MGCDMVVALGPATGDGHTLFGHNSDRPPGHAPVLQRIPGRSFALGETVKTQCLAIPQVRQTYTVLGVQPTGSWGLDHGINSQRVAMGRAALHTRLRCEGPALLGTDLVRLVLERARSARHGVDVLVDLMDRHGQGGFFGCPVAGEADNAFLIADAAEAFAIETSGKYWVCQEVKQVRAAGNVSVIRQDWNRIAPGLAGHAIARGWWAADGNKLDFAGTLCNSPTGHASGLRRWGRAMLLLEQQNGHIDVPFVRRLLSDHYEGLRDERDPFDGRTGPTPLCQHGTASGEALTVASWVADLGAPEPSSGHESSTAGRGSPDPAVAWVAFGPPCIGVYFPVFLDADLPRPFALDGSEPGSHWGQVQALGERLRHDRARGALVRETFGRLQACFDQDCEEFVAEAATLVAPGESAEFLRLAGIFMQHNFELFQEALAGIQRALVSTALPVHGAPSRG